MTLETWILIIAVFAAVVLLRLGRHRYTRRQRVLTVVVLVVLALRYVKGMPTTGNDVPLEIACLGLGALFGFAMLASTAVEEDETTGQVWVRAGVVYLALWVVLLGSECSLPIQPPDGLIEALGTSSLRIISPSRQSLPLSSL